MLPRVAVFLLCLLGQVRGHGYMIDPPARSSLWRLGFNTPINYNDNALNCGGYQNEHFSEHGRCGVCGDPFGQPQPRDNEAGGKYGRGVIGKHYQVNQDIHIGIEITANHEGYFEFRLCKNDDVTKVVSQSCLDNHLLQLKNGTGSASRYHLRGGMVGGVHLTATLPSGVTCSQCVLQWKWRAGNNYGLDANHHSCRGCGPQEEFYGCADISIGYSGVQPQTQAPVTRPANQTPYPTYSPTNPPTIPQLTPKHQDYGPYSTCHSVNNWEGLEELNRWCVLTCLNGTCPSFLCYCPDAFPVSQPPATPAPVTPRHSAPPITYPTYTPPPVTPKIVAPTLRPATTQKKTTYNPNVLLGPKRLTGYNEFDACRGTGLWGIGSIPLDNWCVENCAKGNCPSIQCSCPIYGQNSPTTKSPVPQTTAYVQTTKPPVVASKTTLHAIPYVPTNPRTVQTGSSNTAQEVQSTPTRITGHGKYDTCHGVGLWGLGLASLDNWCIENCEHGNCPTLQCYCPGISGQRPTSTHTSGTTKGPTAAPILVPGLTPGPKPILTAPPSLPPQVSPSHHLPHQVPSKFARCHGVNNWQGVPQLDEWCRKSCAVNYCPSEMCDCPYE